MRLSEKIAHVFEIEDAPPESSERRCLNEVKVMESYFESMKRELTQMKLSRMGVPDGEPVVRHSEFWKMKMERDDALDRLQYVEKDMQRLVEKMTVIILERDQLRDSYRKLVAKNGNEEQ